MANSVTARFNDDCKVHVAMSDDTTVTKAVIIDADGNETDIGGGGGSSDFSTAEVVITNNAYAEIHIPYCNNNNITSDYLITDSGTYDIILYKNKAMGIISEGDVVTTGNISYEEGDLIITGDGTITISNSPGA